MLRLRRRLLDRFLTVGLVVLAAGLGAGVWLALSPLSPRVRGGGDAGPAASSRTPAVPLTAADLRILWGGGPEADNPRVRGSGAPEMAQPADLLPFKIRGIIYSPEGSSVVFLDVAGKISLYHVGDVVEAWKVYSIQINGATFSRDGRQVLALLEGKAYNERPLPSGEVAVSAGSERGGPNPISADAAAGERSAEVASARAVVTQSVPAGMGVRASAPIPKDVDSSVAVPRAVVDQARSNPMAAMDGVKYAVLTDKTGKMQGVVLTSVAVQSLAGRFGLAPGDRIIAVNGQSIDSVKKAIEIYNTYGNSDGVRVTIEREGRRRDVFFYAR